ncbi:MAG: nitroreductase family protein [Gudongella sp.]|nr:nitroreductase family protein [Gudongella sp.]
MNMADFLKSRKSTREFKKQNIKENDFKEVKKLLDKMNTEIEETEMTVGIYEYGKHISDSLRGIGGYAGVMIESPHYISIDIKNHAAKALVESGYYMEKLITGINNLGLGSCWVTLNNIDDERKRAIFGENSGNIEYLLAIGYAKPKNPFSQESFSERKGVEEIIFIDKMNNIVSMDTLEERGLGDLLFYIRFAPSTKNLQSWRFIVHNNYVELFLEEIDGEYYYADAGIAMYYFEELAKRQGLNNKWEVEMKPELIDGVNYMYIGCYKF